MDFVLIGFYLLVILDLRIFFCTFKEDFLSLAVKTCANTSAVLRLKIPGAQPDVCIAKFCDTDKCNTKDLVKMPTQPPPTKEPPTALAAYTGASIAISILSLLGGLAISCY